MTSSTSSTLAGSRTVCPFTVVASAAGTLAAGMVKLKVCGATVPTGQATEAVSALTGSPAVVWPGIGSREIWFSEPVKPAEIEFPAAATDSTR